MIYYLLLWHARYECVAGVAQLVEQLICNQQVGGSSPSTSSNMGGFPSGQRGQTVNLLSSDFDGSNPSPSTKKKPSAYADGFLFFLYILRNIYLCRYGKNYVRQRYFCLSQYICLFNKLLQINGGYNVLFP